MAYPAMSAPFSLAGKRLRNRIVHASISTQFPEGARVTERLVNYHANRARGGVAMIVAEPLGMWHGFDVPARVRVWNDHNLDGLARWAEAVESPVTTPSGRSSTAAAAETRRGTPPMPLARRYCPTT